MNIHKIFHTDSPVTALTLAPSNKLFAGTENGTLLSYDLTTFTSSIITHQLGDEIASCVAYSPVKTERIEIWVACGRMAFHFVNPVIDKPFVSSDATHSIDLCDDDDADDALNELSIDDARKHLAFSTDSGLVGVVELATMAVKRMKSQHDSVCGSVKFIPHRPREIVSGGYDSTLLHFDFQQGNILSTRRIGNTALDAATSSPSFVMAVALSSAGVIAVGTADGRLFVGNHGEKRNSKKKTRKWHGLNFDDSMTPVEGMHVANGPIVALAWSGDALLASSLLGNVFQFFTRSERDLASRGRAKTQDIEKVNAMVADDTRIILAGISSRAKGVVEIWDGITKE